MNRTKIEIRKFKNYYDRRGLICQSGCYGNYYSYSYKKGVKLYHETFLSYREAIKSRSFRDANLEHLYYRMAKQRFSCIPYSYGVQIIMIGYKFYIALFLEHVGKQTLGNVYGDNEANKNKMSSVIQKLKKLLEDRGISHTDLHSRNVMYWKGKFYVIDFSPSYIRVTQS